MLAPPSRPPRAAAARLPVSLAVLVGLVGSFLPNAAPAAELLAEFGGPDGFGADCLPHADDPIPPGADVTPAFPWGIHFYDAVGLEVFVSNNGLLGVDEHYAGYYPFSLPLTTPSPHFMAVWWNDVDTTSLDPAASSGLYTQPNRTCWGILPADPDGSGGLFAATWAEVGYYNDHTDLLNSNQIVLRDRSAEFFAGDFDLELRYARCEGGER